MSKFLLSIIFFCATFVCRPLLATEYSVDTLSAFWDSKTSRMSCELSQAIPNYGEAFFSIRPEEPLQFGIFQTRSQGLEVSKANLSTLPAPWRHEFTHLQSYPVFIEQRARSQYISVFGVDAEAMINVLLSSEFPTFTYVNTHKKAAVEQVSVIVSAVDFRAAYSKFMSCRRDLLLYAMSTLQDRVFYFTEASRQVDQLEAEYIGKIVEYMQVMKKVNLVIASDTYSVGRADARSFKPRAKKIADLFVKAGLKKSRITTRPRFLAKDLLKDDKTFRVHIFGPDVLKMFWFNKGSLRLTRKEKQRLDLAAKYMQHQTKALLIKSHTDGMGRIANNQRVSQKRGDAIKRYLRGQGVPADQLTVRAYGERKPIASNRTRQGQAKNRRVEIRFPR